MRLQICALVLLAIQACRPQVPTADVVARVNGEAVSKKTFEDVVARHLRRYGEQRQNLPDGVVARIQESVLSSLIDERIVAQRAEQEGITVSATELDGQLREHKARFRSQEAYEDYLARSNNTEASLREELRKSLVRDRLVDKVGGAVEVESEQVRRYYDENPDHFVQMEQMRAHRLYLAYPPNASSKKRQQIKNQAEQLRARAHQERHDPAAFAALCAKYSEGPEATRGGDLGLVIPGRIAELDRAIAQGLAVLQISDVMDLPQGVAIFRLDEHTAKHRRPLAEVEPSIRTSLLLHLRNERRQNVLRDIKAEAKVDTVMKFEARPSNAAPAAAPAAAPTTAPVAPASAPERQEVGFWLPARAAGKRVFG